MDKEQFVVRTDGGVRIGTSGVIDGKVVLHVKQGKKQDCILLERLIEKIHHAAAVIPCAATCKMEAGNGCAVAEV